MYAKDIETVIDTITEVNKLYLFDIYEDVKDKYENHLTEELGKTFEGIVIETSLDADDAIDYKITHFEHTLNLKMSNKVPV